MPEELTIKRSVLVKVKVTEGFKMNMAIEAQETIKKLDAELQHLDFQSKRMAAELEKKNPAGLPGAKQHIENEKQKRLQAKEKLTEQLRAIGKMAIGSEVVHGSLESFTQIKVGDDWGEVMGVEVVVCDGKIIEIRRNKNGARD